MTTLTKPQFNLAPLPAIDPIKSQESPALRACWQPGSTKRLQIEAAIEMAFAFAGVFVLSAIGAAVWHSARFDWFESIRRFQEMI